MRKSGITQQIPLLHLDMPPHHTSTVDHCTRPVPRVMGYSALFDLNTDEVFTRLDLPLMDPRDIVPYTTIDYPSRDNVSLLPFVGDLSFDPVYS